MKRNLSVIQINTGDVFISKEPVVFCTSLGACVSICVYVKKKKIGGMVQFNLPSKSILNEYNYPNVESPQKFGDESINELVSKICRVARVTESEVVAKIIGGGNLDNDPKNGIVLGEANIEIAHTVTR